MAKIRYRARCKKSCIWLRQYWPVNKEYAGQKKPPPHFEIFEPKPKETEEVVTEDEGEEDNDESGGDE